MPEGTESARNEAIVKLQDYIGKESASGRVTHQKDKVYFRVSWLDPNARRYLENAGLIKRSGNSTELRYRGVRLKRTWRTNSPLFYEADRKLLTL